jgi:hypothetical protein
MKLAKFSFYTFLLAFEMLIASSLSAQIQENFEKGDLSKWKQYPADHWMIRPEEAISGKQSLRQWYDNSSASNDRISISLSGLKLEPEPVIFQFKLRHGSNPSSTNRWAIYLALDEDAMEMHPSGKGNGYALGVNLNSGDDLVKLFEINNGNLNEMINSGFNWEKSVGSLHPAGFKVMRKPGGEWSICIDKNGTFDSLIFCGSATSTAIADPLYFGIYYEYSSTRDKLLWFDDLSISGKFISDTIRPTVCSIRAINDSCLAISFSENMDFTCTGLNSKFLLNESLTKPDTVMVISKDSIILKFSSGFREENWLHLIVQDLADLAANKMITDTLSYFFKEVKFNDICINEIMPDPSPVVRLPEFEYIELYNTTDNPINIAGWTLSYGDEQKTLPPYILNSQQYLIVCQSSAVASFKPFGNTLGIFSAGSFLSNAGSCLLLKSSDGRTISQLCYSSDWFDDPTKNEGGWSLEKIDPYLACSGKENWTVSRDKKGGTPGQQNSIIKYSTDTKPPEIIGVFPDSDSSLNVTFNEVVGINFPLNPNAFTVDHGIGSPAFCSPSAPDYIRLRLIFKNHFHVDTIYSMNNDSSVLDCAGNHLIAAEYSFELPTIPDSQAVVFNEIMYHPISGCPEFIELYNRSKRAINLANFRLGLKDLFSGELKFLSENIEEDKLFFPDEYIVLTAKPESMLKCYPQAIVNSIIGFKDMPVLADDGQKILLLSRDLTIIDQMVYKDAMQFALLTSSIGVSLERLDCNKSSEDPTNWHSASSSSGYCTPGAKNSQFLQAETTNSLLTVNPEVFSPNNDGINDVLNINYCFDQAGFVGNLIVFDSNGRQVKRLANNELLSTRGQFFWDGSDDSGASVLPGIYIIWFEIFNLAGKTEVYKKVCVISRIR